MLRTLLFIIGLGIILYYLSRAISAFFGQIGRQSPLPKADESDEPATPKIRPEDIEDAEFQDIIEQSEDSETSPNNKD